MADIKRWQHKPKLCSKETAIHSESFMGGAGFRFRLETDVW